MRPFLIVPRQGLKPLSSLFVISLLSVGCGAGTSKDMPNVAPVTGKVTLDGNPLVGARIAFYPQGDNAGSAAGALTDDEGNYELYYSVSVKGAAVGENKVEISHRPDDQENVEKLPAKYNTESTIIKHVKADEENVFDFQLTSD